jgi:hypothetical protein
MTQLEIEDCVDCNEFYQFIHDACLNLKKLILVDVDTYPYPFKGGILSFDTNVFTGHFKIVLESNQENRVIKLEACECSDKHTWDELWNLYTQFNCDRFADLLLNDFIPSFDNVLQASRLEKCMNMCEQMTHFGLSGNAWFQLNTRPSISELKQRIIQRIKHCEANILIPPHKYACIIDGDVLGELLKVGQYDLILKLKEDGISFYDDYDELWEGDTLSIENAHFLVFKMGIKPSSITDTNKNFRKWMTDVNPKKFKRYPINSETKQLTELVFVCSKSCIDEGGVTNFVSHVNPLMLKFLLDTKPEILLHKPNEWIVSFRVFALWDQFIKTLLRGANFKTLDLLIQVYPEDTKTIITRIFSAFKSRSRISELHDWFHERVLGVDDARPAKRKLEIEHESLKKQKIN